MRRIRACSGALVSCLARRLHASSGALTGEQFVCRVGERWGGVSLAWGGTGMRWQRRLRRRRGLQSSRPRHHQRRSTWRCWQVQGAAAWRHGGARRLAALSAPASSIPRCTRRGPRRRRRQTRRQAQACTLSGSALWQSGRGGASPRVVAPHDFRRGAVGVGGGRSVAALGLAGPR